MLESYFKSEDEKAFVQREIAKITLCNEFAELYLATDDYYECIRNSHLTECGACGKRDLEACEGEPCQDCGGEFVGRENEVFQWFLVDSYLAKKLEEIGEPVLHTDSHTLWGRTCCGQAVELDGTFQEIFRNVEKR